MKKGCIIVAGGKGVRMGGALPKQYMEIAGVPILMRTLRAFRSYDEHLKVVVCVPADDIEIVQGMVSRHIGDMQYIYIVSGGETRTCSVLNGLSAMPADVGRIGVHDGVRPFVTPDMLDRLFGHSAPAVIPLVPCTDSVRLHDGGYHRTIDRSLIGFVQTPQVFDAGLLRSAYKLYMEQGNGTTFTDDASLVETLTGVKVATVVGDELNIKLTTPKDMILGEWIATQMK